MVQSSHTLEARRAHRAVVKAVARGTLIRPDDCEKCGFVGRVTRDIEAHHDDYTKPLEVRWLCSSCHKRHHFAERAALKAQAQSGATP